MNSLLKMRLVPGLLNRLSESNVESIAGEMSTIFHVRLSFCLVLFEYSGSIWNRKVLGKKMLHVWFHGGKYIRKSNIIKISQNCKYF